MAIEQKRGCGYRKVGGIYLVTDGPGMGCHRLPMNMHVCPTCSAGVKQSRGFTWIDPQMLFGTCTEAHDHECHGANCRVCYPPPGRHGLMWIGKKFYTPESFTREAIQNGISKRISAIPREFEIGKTRIYLAHLEAGETPAEGGNGDLFKRCPAVFYSFTPVRIEKIITESESRNEVEMEKLKKAGITPIIVPDNDPDHRGSVHDKQVAQE